MKKVLLSIFAVAALASCFQNEELVGAGNKTPIEFADAYVGGVTKAIDGSYSNNNMFDKFQVYGTLENNGVVANIFNGVDVMKGGAGWYYSDEFTTYWISGNTYNFKAVVAGNETNETAVAVDANGMPTTITLSDASAQNDILYAEKLDIDYTGNAEPVRFVFEHLLAKAKVSVRNIIPVDNGGYYVVKDVKLNNAIESAIYDIETKSWANHADDYVLEFGHIVATNETAENAAAINLGLNGKGSSNYERLIVPQANCPLTISINCAYYDRNGAEHLSPVVKEISTVANIEAGKAYNFVLTLAEPGEKIEFDVLDITEWDEERPVYEGKTVYVAGAAALADAIENSDATAVVLTEDIDLATRATIGLTIARDLILDGNGHKIVSAHDRAINVSGAENVTIKNLVIEATGERAINLIQGAKKVTIEDVTAASANYTVNVAASAPDANVTISNSTLTGLNTVNIAGANAVVTINDSTIICNDQNESENYYAIAMNKDATNAVVTVNGGEIIVNGGSYAGSVSSNDASLVLNGTETHGATIRVVNFAIVYGNNYYAFSTLAEAIEVVKAGETIELVRDVTVAEPITIPAGKSVVLNLNGHKLSGTDNATGSYALITNQGNLTIQGTGKLELSATNNRGWNAYSSVISNTVGGTLTVNGGTIEHLGGTDMAYGIDNLTNGKGTKAVTIVNGGTVKSTYRAIRQFLNGVEATNELYVNGGVIEGANKSIWMQDPNKNANPGKLVVEAGAQLKGNVYLYVTAGSTEWPVEVSIASAALVDGSEVLTGNVPAGYMLVEENGVWSVIKASFVSTPQALKDAIAANKATIYVQGEIDLKDVILSGYNGTIIGVDNTACLNTRNFTPSADEAYQLRCTALNFKDITIKVPAEDGDFLKTGFVGLGALSFDNCVFEGQVTLNGGATWTFNKCKFGGADNGAYPSFVYGATKATFTDCSFSGVDRAAKIYGTGGVIDVEYNNCTFTSTTSNKYAVNIDASYATTKVALNGCSQTGTPGLYAVTGAKATVWVDGVQK